MYPHRLSAKLFLTHGAAADLEPIIPVFHGWIQRQALAGHKPIDVANYAHVPDGPGVALICLEANVYLDRFDNRPGLTYQRKLPYPGDLRARLAQALGMAARAAALLEAEPALAGLTFRRDLYAWRLADRLLAPNEPSAWMALKPTVEALAGEVLGPGSSAVCGPHGLELLEVEVAAPAAPAPAELARRLGL